MVIESVKKGPDYSWLARAPISKKYRLDVLRREKAGSEIMTYEEAQKALAKNKRRYPQFEYKIVEID